MVRWVIIVTASALVIVFTACTGMGIETHPVSGVPTESKMAELPSDPPARLSGTKTTSAQNSQFTGNNTFTEVDNDGDGLFEALLVNVEVQSSVPGEYSIFGVLQKGGDFDFVNLAVDINVRVAENFRLQGDLSKNNATIVGAGGVFDLGSGTHTVDLQFSGSPLHQSREDGPYDGTVNLIDATGHTLQSLTFVTQAYKSDSFSEQLTKAKGL